MLHYSELYNFTIDTYSKPFT